MKNLTIILLGMTAYFWATECPAATITVNWDGSGDYTNIQAGIDAATADDEVVVSKGRYSENINFGGKDIILTSVDPEDWAAVAATVIDGRRLGPVVRFDGSESSDCKLSGFTITKGYGPADGDGGGITGLSTSATIANCIITDNIAQRHGGGIRGVNGLINRCIIRGNSAFERNGGALVGCHGTISNCLIYNNTATLYGGAMVNNNGDIVNCTIVDNTAGVSGGGIAWSSGTITNCIIWGNNFEQLSESVVPTYSCIQDWSGGGAGNIFSDPEFFSMNDFHLAPQSPCIDAGTNSPPSGLPPEGIEGNPRPMDGDGDGRIIADMGAYENQLQDGPFIELSTTEVEFTYMKEGPNPGSRILTIRNAWVGTLNWVIAGECDWLEVSPISGSSTGQINEVTLSADTTGLVVGEYNCELTITAAGAVNSPRSIVVNLRVVDPLCVPAEYETIQAAIDSAVDGDVVLVANGTYTGEGNYNISIWNKAITLQSENGPENCIIHCADTTNLCGGLDIFSDQGSSPVVNGFTITNANNSAIICSGGQNPHDGWAFKPTIANCIITENRGYRGGGIFCGWGSSPVITNCVIKNNSATSEWEIIGGGGIFCEGSNVTIVNSTIVGNSTSGNGGGVLCYNSNVKITNSIVWDNRASNGPELAIDNEGSGWWLFEEWPDDDYSSVLTVSYSDVRGGEDAVYIDIGESYSGWWPGLLEWGQGNINTEPLFVEPGYWDSDIWVDGDYHLLINSPCTDSGDNFVVTSDYDLDGNPRIINGRIDMGAYESFAPDVPYMATIPNEFIFYVFESGPNPAQRVLQIRNVGPDSFDWEIFEDCPWLQVQPTTGQISTQTEDVVLQVDKTGLGVGCYNCQLTVLSEQAANSPHTVEVKLYVYLDGAIPVSVELGTIQGAINAAGYGDTIMVAPGRYYENIDVENKNITLTSMNPDDWAVVEGTVIDGRGLDSVVKLIDSHEVELTGFTITGGNANNEWPYRGGGIAGFGATATIAKCIIKGNIAARHGGGIGGIDGVIEGCRIFNNSALLQGGGLVGCHGRIVNCLIYDNTASGLGGGMMQCDGGIINCTITDNTASEGGGVSHCEGYISNCVIWGNDFEQVAYSSEPTYSCIQGFYSGRGNINTEPGFVNAPAGDYHLRFDSACVDAGKNREIREWGPNTDIDGNVRPFDGNHDGVAVTDMGAYEVSPPEAPYMALNQSVFVFHCLEGGPNPAEQILEISNPGTGSFGWEIAADCDWLGVFPTTGETTEEASEVTLQVDSAGLEGGGHICELTILSSQAVNPGAPGLTVWVMLNIYNEGDIIVPVDYGTIQGAINAASEKETIIVEPGMYNENIDFGGKNITLRSIKPENKIVVKRTIIQGDGTSSVVRFAGTEDPNCRLAGFTITGGNVPGGGGGIRGLWTNATVANCIVKNNTAGKHGGGIHSINGCIDSCTIYGNTAVMDGGGIAYSDGRIVNCLVYGNRGDSGSGIVECNGDIVNCTVIKNSGNNEDEGYGGGITWCRGTITNCLVWGNDGHQVATPDKSIVTYCCIQDWVHEGVGNITTDPLFINAQSDDYRLSLGSACVDGGTNTPPGGLAEADIEGNIRLIDGDYNGVTVVDIGAFEQTELVGIEISGPGKVTEDSTAVYELIARHQNDSSGKAAGGAVNWRVEPATYASIDDDGVLWTQEVDNRQEITIYAEYVMNGMRMETEKVVSILPVCPAGAALQLDGQDDYVEISCFKGVTGVRSRTVSAWIKTTMTTIGEIISWGYAGDGNILDGEETGGDNWRFMVLDDGNLRLWVGGGGINGSTIVADGEWHHVAAVLKSDGTPDLSDIKLYVDGIEESTTSPSQPINTVGYANVQVGVFGGVGRWLDDDHLAWPPANNERYFEGVIDEVRIWNVARSREEIQANMHRPLKGDEPGLVGYWNFDEGQGLIIYDLSPKGNNGYLRHGPVWVDSDVPIGFCNTPPVADAGDDQTVCAWIDGIVEVKLDGSGSYDPDGDALEYFWLIGDEQIATGVDPNVELGVGEHTIELIVEDETESSGPNAVVVTVIEPIEADVYIVPRAINRASHTKRIIAIMRLPKGIGRHDVADEPFKMYVDEVDGEPIESSWQRVIGWGPGTRVFALFDKDKLMDSVAHNGMVELTIAGRLKSGQYVYGRDTARIIRPRRRRGRLQDRR